MYVLRTIEILSCNHCGCEKLIIIVYSEGVFVALVIQHAMSMHHSHLWPARLYHIITHCLTQCAIFKNKCYWIQNGRFVPFTNSAWKISHSKKNWAEYDQKCIWSSRKIHFLCHIL